MSLITDLGNAVAAVASAAGPVVVGVGHRWAVGSGVAIGNGRVLTNAHNLARGRVGVATASGDFVDATVLGADIDADLAVLEADLGDQAAISWTGDADPNLGWPVVALGNPGGRGLRVTLGFVSGLDRTFRGPRGGRIRGSFEHTAPLLPGSSGGPVVSLDGELLGINTHRLGSGFYLAIPAGAALRTKVENLSSGLVPQRRRLGVGLAPAHVARRLRKAVGLDERTGLLVRSVEAESPAARAGIIEGDLLIGAGGRDLETVDDLHAALDTGEGSLEVSLVRGVDEMTVTAEF